MKYSSRSNQNGTESITMAHTSIWLGKRESDFCIELYGAQKAKGLFTKLKYQKFQALISKWDVLLKNDQMLWIVMKPNEKLQRYVISFVGGHICSFL